jgi:hypothetical protein
MWYKTAQRKGILDSLESGKITTTNIEIPLHEVIENEADKLELYSNHKEFLAFSKSLKY